MQRRFVVMVAFAWGVMGCPETDLPGSNNPTSDMPEEMSPEEMTPDVSPDMSPQDMPEVSLSLTSITPETGPQAGGTEVTLTGTGFVSEMIVTFGGVESTAWTLRSETEIVATTPAQAQAGAVDVTIDRDGDQASRLGAFTYTADMPTRASCVLGAQSPVMVEAGAPSARVSARVSVPGVTDGAGAGVVVEFGYGADDAYEGYIYAAGAYVEEGTVDEVHDASFTVADPGMYRYAARFRVGDDPWTYCDRDGGDVSADQLGRLEVTQPGAVQPVSFCRISSGAAITAPVNTPTPGLRAVVFADGITAGQGEGAGLEAELGYGGVGADLQTFTYGAMAYLGDADGLMPGDASNDEYVATLTLPVAGTYAYVVRVRGTAPESPWFYCDVDGHDDNDPFETDQLGALEIRDQPAPEISFCRTETPSAGTQPNVATGEIAGVVLLPGVTTMAGQGAGVSAELVWGDPGADPTTWTNTVTATYKEDADNAGLPEFDRYTATVTPTMVGDVGYAFRFSADAGATWSYCDTDGVAFLTEVFEPTKVGMLGVSAANKPDYCAIQFPVVSSAGVVGVPMSFFGRVYEQGVTDVSDGDATLAGELWVGAAGDDPVANPGAFTKVAATFNSAQGDDDEFVAMYSPTSAGNFQFFYRFSVDSGATFLSCDLSGGATDADFDPSHVGAFAVAASAPDLIDYCHIFAPPAPYQKSLVSAADPDVTMELYEAGVTEGNAGANGSMIEVEAGHGPAGSNPALAYSWSAIPYARVSPGQANNYQYEGPPYATAPALGTYGVSVRARKVGSAVWTYCDSNQTTMDFLYDAIPTLEVVN